MKEAFDLIADFIKKLMQPMLTFVMVVIFYFYAASGKFTPDQVWQVAVGVIVFWFGYTAIKNFNFNGTNGNGTLPKADGPIGTIPAPAGWGTCQTCGSDTGTSKTAYTGSTVGFTPIAATDTPTDQINPVDKAIDGIIKDIEADGIKSNVASLSARMISWFANHSDELLPAEQQQFIATGLAYASRAFNEATGYPPPLTFVEVERPQTYWLNLPKQCKNCGDAVGRPLVMALRNWLRLKEGK